VETESLASSRITVSFTAMVSVSDLLGHIGRATVPLVD